MKAKLELNKQELKEYLKKKPFTINFPKLEQRTFYLIILTSSILIILSSMIFYNIGEKDGTRFGYDKGYDSGEKECLESSYEHLTLKEAFAYQIKYKLDTIFGWLGLIVGIGWIVHGVGFRII